MSPTQNLTTGIPHQLSTADVRACVELADDREWPCEDHKWDLLLRVGQGYGLADPRGGLAAAAVLTRFDDLAAISMVLVAARHGRRGLGTRIMRHLLDECAAAGATATLYATSMGRPLYEKLGFTAVSTTSVHNGELAAPASGATRPAGPEDLPAIGGTDAEAVGVDRTRALARLPAFADHIRVVDRGGVTGYGAAWRPSEGAGPIVGPVIARSEEDARALIADLAADAGGRVRLDIDERHRGLAAWAAAHGCPPGWSSVSMVHGGRPLPGAREHLYLPFMQALG